MVVNFEIIFKNKRLGMSIISTMQNIDYDSKTVEIFAKNSQN